MLRRFFLLLSVSLVSYTLPAQERPKIGLTLSGGGAKGLAHIGILKAIDKAGLKIDYITGTSMGSIVGALYAAGYSADTIEYIALNTNWSALLSNKSPLRSFALEEKDEIDKYAIELPVQKGKFKLPSGMLVSEELWLTLEELFFPVHNIQNFNKFNIPFRCVASDIETGEAVILDSGNIVEAVRASMSMPSIFTPVEINNKHLVDGGLVINFPVKEVIDMGADFVIGSTVHNGLRPAEELETAMDILYQATFFKESSDYKSELKLCNVLIKHDLPAYNSGSFNSANEIIYFGELVGQKYVETFRKIADSLQARYPDTIMYRHRLPKSTTPVFSQVRVNGLKKTEYRFLINRMAMDENPDRKISAQMLSQDIRKAFGTRYYKKISYSLKDVDSACSILHLHVEENPMAVVKGAINYNSFLGASLIVNLTVRNFFLSNSRTILKINISQNPKLDINTHLFLGKHIRRGLTLGMYGEATNYNNFTKGVSNSVYTYGYLIPDINYNHTLGNTIMIGVGQSYHLHWLSSSVSEAIDLAGKNSFFESYFFVKSNTLNRVNFATSGNKFLFKIGYNYLQNQTLAGSYFDPDNVPTLNKNDYIRTIFKLEQYTALSHKLTLLTNVYAGISLFNINTPFNNFILGGTSEMNYNQLPFIGLYENEVSSSNTIFGLIGLQYHIAKNFYGKARFNTGYMNLNPENLQNTDNRNFYDGYGLSLGYKSILGPMELTAMRSDNTGVTRLYLNVGYFF